MIGSNRKLNRDRIRNTPIFFLHTHTISGLLALVNVREEAGKLDFAHFLLFLGKFSYKRANYVCLFICLFALGVARECLQLWWLCQNEGERKFVQDRNNKTSFSP